MALNFGINQIWDSLAHLLPVMCMRSQVANTAMWVLGQVQQVFVCVLLALLCPVMLDFILTPNGMEALSLSANCCRFIKKLEVYLLFYCFSCFSISLDCLFWHFISPLILILHKFTTFRIAKLVKKKMKILKNMQNSPAQC